MNRRSFLKIATASPGAVYRRHAPSTQHLIFVVNGGGARKKDYYEDAALAPNVQRIAEQGFVFEEDHCESVSSHDRAFGELFRGLEYSYVESLATIPAVMQRARPRILVCRDQAHDVGHSDYQSYLHAIRATDRRIGALFGWVTRDRQFSDKTAIIIRPEFGRDDEVNRLGELHHSYGFYYTHRVASIFWGPDFRKGIDKRTVISSSDVAPAVARLFDIDASYDRGRVPPGLFR